MISQTLSITVEQETRIFRVVFDNTTGGSEQHAVAIDLDIAHRAKIKRIERRQILRIADGAGSERGEEIVIIALFFRDRIGVGTVVEIAPWQRR